MQHWKNQSISQKKSSEIAFQNIEAALRHHILTWKE